MRKSMVFVMVFAMGCCFGAEEAADAASSSWMPVVGELASMIITIVGPALTIIITALVWKLLGKLGVEKNVAIDVLMRKYIKQGINYADSWAEKQAEKPVGEQKMATAIKHILGLVADSKLPQMAEDKLKDMIESQLSFDKKQAALPNEVVKPKEEVING